ncbi:alpha/beta hydrolase family protein [Streptomyces profundus]|uniref:alpha/beta hydrolase family protein n=1 Tax=Streptomyces profundus TaxID=2867410 RepID=UPI001D16B09F|nr:alpha/beta fold hydrolase [Streptomyces sp. MA3_2.13]UED87299.1 alpha/beta hydrolase [Streptomyces sp. MA3_2.13]
MTTDNPPEPAIHLWYDESRRDYRSPDRPRPVRVYRWRPAPGPAEPAPLIVVSHGTGGSGGSMGWLAEPLAAAGFEVISVDHHGNNFVDGYDPEGFLYIWERPRDLSFALDRLAAERPIGPVGAAGFSVGGYTVAALAGGRADRKVLEAVLDSQVPLPPIPEFPDLLEALAAKAGPEELRARFAASDPEADLTDPRVRAVFQIAPAVGPLVSAESLRAVRVPVGIRWGGADTITPFAEQVEPYLTHIPTADGRSLGADVRHDDFIADPPADPTARPRAAADAVAFFRHHLAATSDS